MPYVFLNFLRLPELDWRALDAVMTGEVSLQRSSAYPGWQLPMPERYLCADVAGRGGTMLRPARGKAATDESAREFPKDSRLPESESVTSREAQGGRSAFGCLTSASSSLLAV